MEVCGWVSVFSKKKKKVRKNLRRRRKKNEKKKEKKTHPVSAEDRRRVRVVEVRVQQPQIARLYAQLRGQARLVDARDRGTALGVDLEPGAACCEGSRGGGGSRGRGRSAGGRGHAGGEGPAGPRRGSPRRVVRRRRRSILLLIGQRRLRQRRVRGERGEAAGARRAAERRRRSCRGFVAGNGGRQRRWRSHLQKEPFSLFCFLPSALRRRELGRPLTRARGDLLESPGRGEAARG